MKTADTQRFLFLIASLGLIFTSTQSGCGCTDSATGSGGFGQACHFSPACGQMCTTDSDCPAGLYCPANGMCTADCHGTETACPGGATCDSRGRCGGSTEGGGGASSFATVGSGTHHGGAGQGGACGDISIQFEPVTPTVTLLIDQSGSMTTDFPPGSGVSRWQSVYNAVMDPAMGPAKTLEADVRFGLVLYTGDTSCPQLQQVMPPVKNNYAAMNALWSTAIPINNTPTAESISAIVPEILAITKKGPKLILLATDGDPDDCACPDCNGQPGPKNEAVAAVQAAFTQGIQLVDLAVGDQVNAQHQQDMGNAGVGLPVPAPASCLTMPDPTMCAVTYKPTDQAAMIQAFNDIIKGQRTCVFTLDGKVVAGKECQGTVKINGMTVPCNDPNGWKLDDPMTIEFTGTACDEILNDPNVMISAHFPCDAASTGSGVPH